MYLKFIIAPRLVTFIFLPHFKYQSNGTQHIFVEFQFGEIFRPGTKGSDIEQTVAKIFSFSNPTFISNFFSNIKSSLWLQLNFVSWGWSLHADLCGSHIQKNIKDQLISNLFSIHTNDIQVSVHVIVYPPMIFKSINPSIHVKYMRNTKPTKRYW